MRTLVNMLLRIFGINMVTDLYIQSIDITAKAQGKNVAEDILKSFILFFRDNKA